MENENNNYSFTPIMEDNSVNEIKNDFFGGNSSEPSNPATSEVPPILEVPEIKEEVAPVVETIVNDAAAPVNTVETSSETPTENVSATEPETNIEEVKQESSNEAPVVNEEVTVNPEPITEVNQTSVQNTPSEPVEVKIPEGLDEETTETTPEVTEPVVNNLDSTTTPSDQPTPVAEPVSNQEPAPVVEQPVQVTEQVNNPELATSADQSTPVSEPVNNSEPVVAPTETVNTQEPITPVPETVNNAEPKVEAPKKGKSIFDFFKKEAPTVNNPKPEPSIETPSELDPFNNFVADVPESEPTPTAPVVEPVIEPVPQVEPISVPEPVVESPSPSIEETPVIEENKEDSIPNVDEPIPEPVIEPIPKAENDLPTFDNIENNLEPVKEPEPIVKEVVVEKEKVVLGKKCSNCGEVTAETFCPNCGFLVE